MVSTPYFYITAVSSQQLLGVRKLSRMYIARTREGWGASSCLCPAHGSPGSHVFLMTSSNRPDLCSQDTHSSVGDNVWTNKCHPAVSATIEGGYKIHWRAWLVPPGREGKWFRKISKKRTFIKWFENVLKWYEVACGVQQELDLNSSTNTLYPDFSKLEFLNW